MAIKKTAGKSAGAVSETKVLGKAVFQLERETPGAVRYYEVDADGNKLKTQDAFIGQIYIRKDRISGKVPQVLKVTVEA